MKRILRPSALAISLLLGLACASARVDPAQNYVGDERLPKPPVLLVYDFAVSADDVVHDTLGSEFARDSGASSKEIQEARQVAIALSNEIVAKVSERGINATRATSSSVPPENALVLKGQFLTIDKGSRIKRMTIGFGAGSSELRVRAQVYQATPSGLRRIAQAEAESHGSKTPGMALPMVGGAAMGSAATSAVISGGMNVTREVRGRGDADAARMAEEIAKRAEAFYQRQGWL